MKNLKRISIFLLAIALCSFSLAGCSTKEESAQSTEPAAEEQVAVEENTGDSEEPVVQENPTNAAFLEAEKKLEEALAPLPEGGNDIKIAALEITLANPFWITMKEGYEAAAEEYGVSVDVMATSKEGDVNEQLDMLNTIVSKDYKAVAISSITPFNLIPGVVSATEKGLPVIAVGTSVDSEEAKKAGAKVEAFVTSNFEDQGKLGAEYIMEKIGSGKVAIIEGLAGAAQGEARKTGAKNAFEGNSDIEIVSVQAGNWDRQTAYDIATNLLQANPDLKGIFCANDVMALGVVEALKAADMKDQVVVVGVDAIDEAKDSIRNKELDGTVAMSPYLFGKAGLILSLKVIEGHEISQDIFWTPLGLITEENLDTYDGWK